MAGISRRRLADYAAEQLAKGVASKDVAKQLAAYLVAHQREKEFTQLLSDIALNLETKASHAYATVVSARELTDASREAVRRMLTSELQVKNVELEERIDPSVVGGALIETAGTTYDSTVSHKLKQLSAKV